MKYLLIITILFYSASTEVSTGFIAGTQIEPISLESVDESVHELEFVGEAIKKSFGSCSVEKAVSRLKSDYHQRIYTLESDKQALAIWNASKLKGNSVDFLLSFNNQQLSCLKLMIDYIEKNSALNKKDLEEMNIANAMDFFKSLVSKNTNVSIENIKNQKIAALLKKAI